jgi:hypothetical protein
MIIAFAILYAIGSLSALVICFFLVCLGGRNPRLHEWLLLLAVVLFWPIAVPIMIFKFFAG